MAPKAQPTRRAKHPAYLKMVVDAITFLAAAGGLRSSRVNGKKICEFVTANYNMSASSSTVLKRVLVALDKGVASKEIVKLSGDGWKATYCLPDKRKEKKKIHRQKKGDATPSASRKLRSSKTVPSGPHPTPTRRGVDLQAKYSSRHQPKEVVTLLYPRPRHGPLLAPSLAATYLCKTTIGSDEKKSDVKVTYQHCRYATRDSTGYSWPIKSGRLSSSSSNRPWKDPEDRSGLFRPVELKNEKWI